MVTPFPKLDPIVRTGLERYLSEIETAPFVSHERNVILPSRVSEVLRIDVRFADCAVSPLDNAIQSIERAIVDIESSEFHSSRFHKTHSRLFRNTISHMLEGAAERLRDVLAMERETRTVNRKREVRHEQ